MGIGKVSQQSKEVGMTEPGTTKGLLPLARRTRWLRAGLPGGGAARARQPAPTR